MSRATKRAVYITVGKDWKPGDPEPSGYLDWHEWAEVQHKAGLRQQQCGACSRWAFPQSLSDEQRETTHYIDRAMTQPVKVSSRICLSCAAKPRHPKSSTEVPHG